MPERPEVSRQDVLTGLVSRVIRCLLYLLSPNEGILHQGYVASPYMRVDQVVITDGLLKLRQKSLILAPVAELVNSDHHVHRWRIVLQVIRVGHILALRHVLEHGGPSRIKMNPPVVPVLSVDAVRKNLQERSGDPDYILR